MSNEKKHFHGGLVIALFLISLGTIWILNNLDVLDIRVSQWWPIILIAVGVIQFSNVRSINNPSAWILICLGTVFLLATNDIVMWDNIWKFWPIILVIIGFSILLKRTDFQKISDKTYVKGFSGHVILGDVKKNINSKAFTGGSMSTLIGDTSIDLHSAELDEKGAVIDLSTIFGDIKVYLPISWPIEIRTSTILGDVKNKSSNEIRSSGKRLIINARVIFGDVKIDN